VFWFSVRLLSETFLLLWRIQRDFSTNSHKSLRKVAIVLVRYEWNLDPPPRQIFEKFFQVSNFMKIRPVGAELSRANGADMTKLKEWLFAILLTCLKIRFIFPCITSRMIRLLRFYELSSFCRYWLCHHLLRGKINHGEEWNDVNEQVVFQDFSAHSPPQFCFCVSWISWKWSAKRLTDSVFIKYVKWHGRQLLSYEDDVKKRESVL
jgi:hypothetical protein